VVPAPAVAASAVPAAVVGNFPAVVAAWHWTDPVPAPALQALDAEESAIGLEVLGIAFYATKDLLSQ
jgi:hypothetical protein